MHGTLNPPPRPLPGEDLVVRPTNSGRSRFIQFGRLRLERVVSRLWAADLLVVHRALDLLVAAAWGVVAERWAT